MESVGELSESSMRKESAEHKKAMSKHLLCQLTCCWLTLKEFIALDVASSRALHEELMSFVKTSQFREAYGEQFRTKTATPSITWVRNVEANVNVFCHWNRVRTLTEGLVCQSYNFVKDLVFDIDNNDTKANITEFGNLAAQQFPKVENLLINFDADSEYFLDLLNSLNSLARVWALKDLAICSGSYDDEYRMSGNEVNLLRRLISTLGDRLENLTFSNFFVIPISVIDTLVQYCPNITSLLPQSWFVKGVTAKKYLKACTSMKNLQELDLYMATAFDIDDSKLEAALQQLGNLKVLRIWEYSTSVASLTACLKYCPKIQSLEDTDKVYCRIFRDSGGNVLYSSVMVESEDLVGSAEFGSFIASVPRLAKLNLSLPMSISAVGALVSQLAQAECSRQLTTLDLTVTDFFGISLIFGYVPNLTTLSLVTFSVPIFGMGFFRCVEEIAMHCSSLSSLTWSGFDRMTDLEVWILIQKLPKLTTLRLQIKESVITLLTAKVLLYLAEVDRVWQHIVLPGSAVAMTDLIEAIEDRNLRIKELLLSKAPSRPKACHFRFGPITVQDVHRKMLCESL